MKKILATLVVLALAMPALAADIDFDVADNGDGSFTITYTATTAPRGIAVIVNTGTAQIVDASAASGTTPAFNCFMDQASEDPGNYVLGTGSPLAAVGAAGLPTFPTNEFSVCIGVLDNSGAQGAGPLTGTVATILTDLEAGECADIDVSVDSYRGGVVGDDALTTNLPIEDYEVCYVGTPCEGVGAADQAEWEAVGEPASWCGVYQCYGDADNMENSYGPMGMFKARVSTEDITILIAGFRQAYSGDPTVDTWIAADFDRTENSYGPMGMFKARVSTEDINILIANFRSSSVAGDCGQ